MPLNPEQFGLEASAAPWTSHGVIGSRALDLMKIVNPVLAYMAQDRQRQAEMLANRPDVRRMPSPTGVGTRILPDLPPGGRRQR